MPTDVASMLRPQYSAGDTGNREDDLTLIDFLSDENGLLAGG